MSVKKMSSCTAMLVGKNASIDGSTMIARNEDYYDGVNPKTFQVYPAKDYTGEHFKLRTILVNTLSQLIMAWKLTWMVKAVVLPPRQTVTLITVGGMNKGSTSITLR